MVSQPTCIKYCLVHVTSELIKKLETRIAQSQHESFKQKPHYSCYLYYLCNLDNVITSVKISRIITSAAIVRVSVEKLVDAASMRSLVEKSLVVATTLVWRFRNCLSAAAKFVRLDSRLHPATAFVFSFVQDFAVAARLLAREILHSFATLWSALSRFYTKIYKVN